MITEVIKNKAIFRLKDRQTPEEVAEDMDLPLPLVKEWHSGLSKRDLLTIESKMHAVEAFSQEVLPPGHEEQLKRRIEEVALNITEQVQLNVGDADIVVAKSLQLAADTVCKLYGSIVNKNINSNDAGQPSDSSITLFNSLMKD